MGGTGEQPKRDLAMRVTKNDEARARICREELRVANFVVPVSRHLYQDGQGELNNHPFPNVVDAVGPRPNQLM